MLFGYFLHNAKSDNSFPCREFRGFANLESAHPNINFPQTKLNPFWNFPFGKFAPFGTAHFVCFFRRSAAAFPAAMPPFWLACGNRPPPCGGLFPTFCKVQKVGQKNFETFLSESCPFRGSTLRVLFRRPQRLLFLHVVRRIAAYLLGGGLVKLAIAQRYLAHRLVAR